MNLIKAAGTLMLLGSSAWANSIIVGELDPSLGMEESLYFDEDGAASQAYWVGGVDVIVNSTNRLVFCVDLFTDIHLNNTHSTILGMPDTRNLQRVAMQPAIWDIVRDNGDDFAPGADRATQCTDAGSLTDQGVLDATFDGIRVQNLEAGAVNDGGPQPTTPAPAPVVPMGGGLALILVGKRRTSRSTKA